MFLNNIYGFGIGSTSTNTGNGNFFNVNVANNLVVGNQSTLNNVDINGNTNINGQLDVYNTTTFHDNSNTLVVECPTIIDNQININNTAVIDGTITSTSNILTYDATFDYTISARSATYLSLSALGFVWVGNSVQALSTLTVTAGTLGSFGPPATFTVPTTGLYFINLICDNMAISQPLAPTDFTYSIYMVNNTNPTTAISVSSRNIISSFAANQAQGMNATYIGQLLNGETIGFACYNNSTTFVSGTSNFFLNIIRIW